MASLATCNFKLSQLYPGAGEYHLNTCANPDCSNFGQTLRILQSDGRPGKKNA